MLDSLADIRVFAQVVDSGGLSAAARVLGIPANTVSRTLSRLEGVLGVGLLARTTRRMSLTEAGRAFYEHVVELLAASARAEAAVSPNRLGLQGTLRVAVRTTTIQFGFVRELSKLLGEHASLRIQLLVSDEEVDLVGAGIDLALRVGDQPDSTLIGRSIGEVDFVLAAAPHYLALAGRPRKPRDLSSHECIRALGARPQTHWRLLGPRGRYEDVAVAGRLECSDVRAQSEAIYAGLGVGVRPAGEVRLAASAGTLERVLPEWKLRPIAVWVVQPPGRAATSRAKSIEAVVDILTAAVARMS